MDATKYQLDDGSRGWAVERCEPENDGVCHKAIFYGPEAERQASQFLQHEYGVSTLPVRRSA